MSGRRVAAAALVTALLAVNGASARGGAVGDMRILAIRAAWGPTIGSDDSLRAELAQASAFFARASYGKASVTFELTQWLRAYPGTDICPSAEDQDDERTSALGPISALARTAAAEAGYDVGAYDRLVFLLPEQVCGMPGLGARGEVLLFNPASTSWLGLVHELGHTLGLGHATSSRCPLGCSVVEYGDDLSPMGRGFVDFSAWEKSRLGWLSGTTTVRRGGRYTIARLDAPSTRPQALVVQTSRGAFWVEHRRAPDRIVVRYVQPRTPSGGAARTILVPHAARSFAVRGVVTIRRVAVRGDTAVIDVRFARR
jgi:hypothetical protein